LTFDFGGAADPDHRDTARELGQTLLKLLSVVVGGGFLDLGLDPAFDLLLLARAIDDGGLLLGDGDPLGAAKHLEGDDQRNTPAPNAAVKGGTATRSPIIVQK
jgi:hypothetical protein